MKTKKKLSEETVKRYCTAGKKQKTKILDEFIATTGYNRKYAIHVLKNTAYVKVTHFNNVARQAYRLLQRHAKSARIKNITGPTYKITSSGCGFFWCICVQNVLCRSFGIISITLLKNVAMMKNWKQNSPAYQARQSAGFSSRKSQNIPSAVFQQHGLQRILISSFPSVPFSIGINVSRFFLRLTPSPTAA